MNVSVAARAFKRGEKGGGAAKAELGGPTIRITSPVLTGEPGRSELARAGKAGLHNFPIFGHQGECAKSSDYLPSFTFFLHVLNI